MCKSCAIAQCKGKKPNNNDLGLLKYVSIIVNEKKT